MKEHPPSAPFCVQFLEGLARLKHLPSIFTLKVGRAWPTQALPPEVSPGPKRQCYENAGLLVLARPDLTYVEGYAYPNGLIPVHHAWCVDSKGVVVDPTYDTPDQNQYYGIPISSALLKRHLLTTKYWGLFAEHMAMALFHECLSDVQASKWAVAPTVEAEMQALLASYA